MYRTMCLEGYHLLNRHGLIELSANSWIFDVVVGMVIVFIISATAILIIDAITDKKGDVINEHICSTTCGHRHIQK